MVVYANEGGIDGVANANEGGKVGADEEFASEGSDTDEDYMPIDMSKSEDGLSDQDLETDDAEYIMARHNRANNKSGTKLDTRNDGETGECEGGGKRSDYEDSEGEVNSDSSSSENEPLADENCTSRWKKNMIIYDPKCDHDLLTFELGMRFESQQQCSSAIQRFAIVNGYDIQFIRTNKKQVEAWCNEDCPFYLYVSLITREGRFAIKQLVPDHVCSRDMGTRQATARWTANEYLEHFRNNPNWKIEDLAIDLVKNYFVQPSKWKLYRGKWMALQLLRGSVSEHYGKLRSYMAALMESDREERPIIGFDGCFLKTFLGEALLCATGKDGKHIIDMLESILTDLMERQHKNLHDMSGVTDKVCPRIRKKIESTKYTSRMCVTKPAIGEMFQVSHGDDQFVVNLNLSTCSCRLWELTGLSCIHVCSAITYMKMDVADHVDDCYTIPVYIVAYQHALQPLNGRKMWPEAIGTIIPLMMWSTSTVDRAHQRPLYGHVTFPQ
ncbi:hypothetical protein ACS0TY_004038 [Phlomoides rotata]